MRRNKYFDMNCLELNIAIANLHPIALNWISDLLLAIRVEKDEMLIMELITELMMYPEPIDIFHLAEAMWLDSKEVDSLKPIVAEVMRNPDYYIAEFGCSFDDAHDENGNVHYS